MIFRLTAGFREKEQVKALGAKFNFQEKYWYYEGEVLPEGLKRWYAPARSAGEIMDYSVRPTRQGTKRESGGRNGKADEFFVERLEESERNLGGRFAPAFMTVSQLNQLIGEKYSMTEEFEHILVQGEVTNYSGHHGTHYYFDIKDGASQLTCRLWEPTAARVLRFELQKGQLVGISGRLEFYEKSGTTQLIVGDIRNLGEGAMNQALLELKNRLQAEGLFAPEHKKTIPSHPQRVGIITSKDGQAIKDICQKAAERDPFVQLVLYDVRVQGKNAVPSMLKGIRFMDGLGLDTIIIGRGGGSDEELMVYNDETIARAVYAAVTPIVSAVGHEGHYTLIDFVADLRVSTPTSAAEHTIPNVMQDIRRLEHLDREIKVNMRNQVERRQALLRERMASMERYHPAVKLREQHTRLSHETEQLGWNMERIFRDRKQRYEDVHERLKTLIQTVYSEKKHRYELLVMRLNGLSPTAKLINGFGYVSSLGQPLTTVETVKEGDELQIRIHDGEIGARVTEIRRERLEDA